MKKYSFNMLAAIATLILVASACSDEFMDRKPDDKLREDQVFSRYEKVNELVTDIYNGMKGSNSPLVFFSHFSASAITDECEGSTVEGGLTNKFNEGAWSPDGMPSNSSRGQYWWDLYERIRRTNVFLTGVAAYNTPDSPLEPGNLKMRIGEVYFARAYFHYLLIRMYGEAVFMDHAVDPQGSMDFRRESFHAVVDRILADCDSAYARVPSNWGSSDFGRVDQGACLGLKAIVRWMAATPMWNGGTFPNDTREFKSEYTYDAQRWEKAKEAAKAVIDFKTSSGEPRYALYTNHTANDFNDDGGKNTSNSKVYTRLWDMYYDMVAFKQEAVFFVTRDKWDAWQGDQYPPSRGGGSRQMPVQEQVDEYEYIAPDGYGYPIYASRAKADGYDDGNPYESVQRDPRFYRDIVYHGATFRDGQNNLQLINTASGSDQIGAANSTTTGYFTRKFLKESWNRDKSFAINGPPIWRLPEIMYIYCEAVNETSGPNQEIYDILNTIRARSFMAPIPPAAKSDKALMNEYIQRERRVELFYENNRVWTHRLYLEPSSPAELAKEAAWQAAATDNSVRSQKYWPYPKTQRMINGMQPIEDPNGKITIDGKQYRMQRFFVESRVFVAPRHYLFPLMDEEIKRSPTLTQNPGW